MRSEKQEIQNILTRIDQKIIEINRELSDVNRIVEGDLDTLIKHYSDKLGDSNEVVIIPADFKSRYLQKLKAKKEESLINAKNRLSALRKELVDALNIENDSIAVSR